MPTQAQLCPHFHRAIELIGRRWTGAIVYVLLQGPSRYAALRDAIPEVTDRMLSERLRELEQEGIIVRRERGGRPVRVEYALTAMGAGLGRAVREIADWSHGWVAETGDCDPDCEDCPPRHES